MIERSFKNLSIFGVAVAILSFASGAGTTWGVLQYKIFHRMDGIEISINNLDEALEDGYKAKEAIVDNRDAIALNDQRDDVQDKHIIKLHQTLKTDGIPANYGL